MGCLTGRSIVDLWCNGNLDDNGRNVPVNANADHEALGVMGERWQARLQRCLVSPSARSNGLLYMAYRLLTVDFRTTSAYTLGHADLLQVPLGRSLMAQGKALAQVSIPPFRA